MKGGAHSKAGQRMRRVEDAGEEEAEAVEEKILDLGAAEVSSTITQSKNNIMIMEAVEYEEEIRSRSSDLVHCQIKIKFVSKIVQEKQSKGPTHTCTALKNMDLHSQGRFFAIR